MFTQLVILLAEKGFITLDVEYIDGTKIESKANKYTFVWRKSTEKNRAKLLEKIKTLLGQIDDTIAQENAEPENGQSFTPAELMDIADELNRSLDNMPATKEQKEKRKVIKKQIVVHGLSQKTCQKKHQCRKYQRKKRPVFSQSLKHFRSAFPLLLLLFKKDSLPAKTVAEPVTDNCQNTENNCRQSKANGYHNLISRLICPIDN